MVYQQCFIKRSNILKLQCYIPGSQQQMWHLMPCLINQTCGAPLALLQHARETFYIVASHTHWILSYHYYPVTKWRDARTFKIFKELAKLWYIGEDNTFINQTNQFSLYEIILTTRPSERSRCWSQSQQPQSTNLILAQPNSSLDCNSMFFIGDMTGVTVPEWSFMLLICAHRLSSFCCMFDNTWSWYRVPTKH